MKREAYTLLAGMESSWWYRGRVKAVRAAHAAVPVPIVNRLLDFGAGFGGMAPELHRFSEKIYAFEPEPTAHEILTQRGYEKTYSDKDSALTSNPEIICLFDVLEHIQDDKGFLASAYTALPENGRIIITVPAYQALWSEHDVTHKHFRRYTKKEVTRDLIDAGFIVEYASYWNMALLVPAAAMRFLGKSGGEGLSPPAPINSILIFIVTLESMILRYFPLPFGLSIVTIGKKVSDPTHRGVAQRAHLLLLKYIITGGIGALIQTISLYVWVGVFEFKDTYLVGVTLGFLLALAVTFTLQKFWTFKDDRKTQIHRQALSYSVVAIIGLTINVTLLATAKSLFEAVGHDFFITWYIVAQIGIVAFVSVINFTLNKMITFR